jgi:hypothetical protein
VPAHPISQQDGLSPFLLSPNAQNKKESSARCQPKPSQNTHIHILTLDVGKMRLGDFSRSFLHNAEVETLSRVVVSAEVSE